MSKRIALGLFLGLAAVQLYVPISMVAHREWVLKHGEAFRFRVVPIDPYDAFRGRYIALKTEGDEVPAQGKEFLPNKRVYALLKVDEQGWAKISGATFQRPAGVPYLLAKTGYVYGGKVTLRLPMDRYYMEEKAAPLAESVYREHSRNDKKDAYITVRIQEGFPVIEGLFVDGKRIEDFIKTLAPSGK